MSTGAGAGDDAGSPGGASGGGPGTPWGTGLLLTGARLFNGRLVDVRLSGDRIDAVGTVGSLRAPERIDLSGYVLLPSAVEPHAHLDEAFSAELGPPPKSGEELRRRMTEAALTYLGYGATALRTHIRLDEETGPTRFDAAMQVARDLRGMMDIQVVPMPGRLGGKGGREGRALLRHALRSGAHAIGGRPDADQDIRAGFAALTAFAGEFGLRLDLHLDARPFTLLQLTPPDSVLCFAGDVGIGQMQAVAERGAHGVVLLPQSSRCVGHRYGEPEPSPKTMTPGRVPTLMYSLRHTRLNFGLGSGGLRDRACPVGRADPVESAFLLASEAEQSPAFSYAAISVGPRELLGLPTVEVQAGYPAELLAVRGDSLAAALSGGHSRVVIHAGRVVSRTSAVREYADVTAAAVPRQVRPSPT